MPRKYDYDAIIASYKELQNKRAVANKLDVPVMTVHQVLQRYSGQCVRCKAPITQGQNSCDECKKYDALRIQSKRQERYRMGLCQDCDKPYDPPSRSYCTEHRLKHQKASEKYEQKFIKTASRTRKTARSLSLKMSGIRLKYGQNGIDCYEEAGGCCTICGRDQSEIWIDIHHINCIETDHQKENLACLCHECHLTVHAVLRVKDPGSFLNWTLSTYPNLIEQLLQD
jgi:hypothetical protein